MDSTLENVLTDMVMLGRREADRAAIVRSAQEGAAPAVCVIMTSKQALRRLGKPILNVARKLGNAEADFGSPQITEKIELGPLFAIADNAPNGWCWASFRFFKLNVTLAIFCREVEAIARVCSDHGAPCALDSVQAPPGYEIEKFLNR